MTGYIVNVTPQDLINTAESFRTGGNTIGNQTTEMLTLVSGLSSAWQGEAANMYMSKFAALDDDIQRMISMINEHVEDLEIMAENYSDSDNEGVSFAETLSTDVII